MSDPETRQPGIWPEAELPRPPETPPEASPPEPQREPRLQPINRNQLCWHAVDVQRLVGPDPLVRAIWERINSRLLNGLITTNLKIAQFTFETNWIWCHLKTEFGLGLFVHLYGQPGI